MRVKLLLLLSLIFLVGCSFNFSKTDFPKLPDEAVKVTEAALDAFLTQDAQALKAITDEAVWKQYFDGEIDEVMDYFPNKADTDPEIIATELRSPRKRTAAILFTEHNTSFKRVMNG